MNEKETIQKIIEWADKDLFKHSHCRAAILDIVEPFREAKKARVGMMSIVKNEGDTWSQLVEAVEVAPIEELLKTGCALSEDELNEVLLGAYIEPEDRTDAILAACRHEVSGLIEWDE